MWRIQNNIYRVDITGGDYMAFKSSWGFSMVGAIVTLVCLGFVWWWLFGFNAHYGSTDTSNGFKFIKPEKRTIRFYSDGDLSAVFINSKDEMVIIDKINISESANAEVRFNIACLGRANPTVVPRQGSFNLEASNCSQNMREGNIYHVLVTIEYHADGNNTKLIEAGTFRGPFRAPNWIILR
jgi:hypothetical protein